MIKDGGVPGVRLFLKCFCFEAVFASIFKMECLERTIVSHAEKLYSQKCGLLFIFLLRQKYDNENGSKCKHDVKIHCFDFLTEYRRDSRRKPFTNTKKKKQQA